MVEIGADAFASAVAPAAPLPYLLVDELTANGDGTPSVVYEAGRLSLSAADAAAVYSFANANEADVNRVQRQRALWLSWLDAVAQRGAATDVLPPASSPLAEFVPVLAAGTAVVEVPPLQSLVTDPAAAPRYVLGEQGQSWLRDEVLELVPRPRQPESFLRPRVKLLDGTGDPAVRDALIDDVIAAGGVVSVVGNAAEFGVGATHFAYHRPELVNDPLTNLIAVALGVDMALVELDDRTPGGVDITVTLGTDQAAR